MKKIFLSLIKIYQSTISPDHSKIGKYLYPHGCCRFYPTCSCYAQESISEYGVIKGGFMAAKRVLKCNPYSKGGFDPVPKKKKENKI